MPSNRPFILTEEDFRAYPVKFAPFVNLAQQVLLENELCLLGFSGDDPNFLHWSGWVRDQLGAAARRIYLVGVLNITGARRKFLDARNVSPIDLAPAVAEIEPSARHRVATERFLDYLDRSKPRPVHHWPVGRYAPTRAHPEPPADVASNVRHIRQMLGIWKQEREAYPGWLACPLGRRQSSYD
jgi:hypothetical protein